VAKGVGLDDYENMVRTAKEAGAKVIVDAKPSFLRVSLPYAWLIKVNQFEAHGLNVQEFRGNLGITCEKSGAFLRVKMVLSSRQKYHRYLVLIRWALETFSLPI